MHGNVIGGDPGTNGGVAVIDPLGKVLYVAGFRPDITIPEFRDVCREAAKVAGPDAFGWVEKVGYMGPRPDNPKGDGGKGSFTFGRGYGWLEMGLCSHDVTVKHVAPMIWQARLECLTGGNKNVSKRRALDLFGAQVPKITHSIADALLIAEYGRVMAGLVR